MLERALHTASSIDEADDVPEAWLVEESSPRRSEPKRWARLNPHEEERLSDAESAGMPLLPMFGGRAEARFRPYAANDPCRGEISHRYERLPTLPLARSRWSYKARNGGWTPFPPRDDTALELLLQRMLETELTVAAEEAAEAAAARDRADPGAEPSAEPAAATAELPTPTYEMETLDGLHRVRISRSNGKSSRVLGDMWSTQSSGWIGPSHCSISRGWAGDCRPLMSAAEKEAYV